MKFACLILACAVLLPACVLRPQGCGQPGILCAGLVTDFGSVNSGLSHEAWLGLQDAQAAHLVDRIDYIETMDVRDRAANIDALTAAGYDVIVTVGISMSEATAAAAKRHPRLSFIGVDQPQDQKVRNLAGLVFHEEQSGFLAGALAAMMTRSGHVAAVCEANFIDQMRRYCDGFQAGARYVQPDINVTVTYRDGATQSLFNDPAWGNSTALEQVQGGADVLFAAGGRTGDAALQAAASQGTYVIGSEVDRYGDLAAIRPFLLSSAISDIRSGIFEILRLQRRGQFPAGEYMGAVKLAPWHDFDRQIPSDVKRKLLNLSLGLKDGTIPPGVPYKQQ